MSLIVNKLQRYSTCHVSDIGKELSDIDKKISALILSSKVLILIGLTIAAFLFPPTLSFLGLAAYSVQSISITANAVIVISMALTVNSIFFLIFKYKKRKIQDFVENSPQRIIGTPLGLSNAGCNCWTNSMIQFMMTIDSIRNNVLGMWFFNRFYGIKSVFSKYQKEDNKPDIKVSSIDSQKIRMLISSQCKSISALSSKQEDVHEAFTAISSILPKVFLKKYIVYSQKNFPAPADVEKKGSRLTAIDDKSFVKTLDESYDFLPLAVFNHPFFTPALSTLIDEFFNNNKVGEMYAEYEGIDGSVNKYPAVSENLRFSTAPDDLFFSLKRFSFNGNFVSEPAKNDTKVDVPAKLHLKKEKHIISGDAKYELDSFIIHVGNSIKNGHYICCVKKDNVWFECSDSTVRVLPEKDALDMAASSYLIHYKKIS